MRAAIATKSEPRGSQKGAKERQERREGAPRDSKIGARCRFAAKTGICGGVEKVSSKFHHNLKEML